ncbi:Enamine deaminase RidA, house cleaning of reactive enamine intermediates, YjgF/YER057c/UK114 family [Actinopolyspora lacussalsi subsp. righensis]|uniref:Enamine deaminase RidA, house cleaning of reactive enamine intermediates, YjgF/YER057c/UK114 family n=2 Tax=Actinopolyspora righensis TaxID=995060 RepID=A0A1I7BQ09_9ACTN|nr:Enamine deaminase RidA, house cleaning of reactive enamine intermediates, YjgF/YER057c/UK114 family [Actinopolyspora righensis]
MSVMGNWTARLTELGVELPEVAKPLASYVPAVRSGNHVHTAGQLPLVSGTLSATGKVGDDVDPDTARRMARICTLNALAAVNSVVELDSLAGVVKVVGFVASAEGFTGQPSVLNGASELLGEVFGESGAHARSAVGVAELPMGAPVEVELIAEIADGH